MLALLNFKCFYYARLQNKYFTLIISVSQFSLMLDWLHQTSMKAKEKTELFLPNFMLYAHFIY